MVVRKVVRDSRRELWFWRVAAVAAATACAGLLVQPVDARSTGDAHVEPRAEERSSRVRSRRSSDDTRRRDSTRLRAMLANLARAESSSAQCMAIERVLRLPELDEEAVEEVARFTEPEHPVDVRRCAGYALGTIPHEAAIAPLRALAQCDNPLLIETALVALALRPDQASRRAAIELSAHAARAVRVAVASALAESGALEAVPLLAGLLDDGSGRDRERLLMALGRCGDPRAVGVLQSYVAKGSRMVQQAAVYALGEVGGPAATETLLSVLRERPELAQAAAGALARSGGEDARAALLELAEQGNGYGAGLGALQALSELDGPGVSELMQRALGEGGPQAQSVAIEYFVNHREHDVLATLEEFARSGTMQASSQAIQALARIGGEHALDVVEEIAQSAGPMAPMALQMLNTDQADPARARKIALAQAEQGNPGALDVLFGDDSPEARAALTKLALSGDSMVSGRALSSLAQRGDEESRKLTEKLAGGSDPQKRASAMWALAQSGDPASLPILRKGLSDRDDNVRIEAVQALGQLPGPESEAALLG
ncbi:MAG TPA: HEAT repeat domain-containing protein, partial [Polyangiales bacterium]